MHHRFASLIVCTMLLLAAGPARAEISGRAFVLDGDSLRINHQMIRLHGIDAPEGRQLCLRDGITYPCGQHAAALLKKLTARQTVRCTEKDRDAYERIVAECFIGKDSLNAEMVKQGWALAYRRYSRAFIALENSARAKKHGIWAGEFQKPWDYRHQNPSHHR